MDDLSFRAEFHRALDPLSPPAPWLAVNTRDRLRARERRSGESKRLWPARRPAWILPAVAALLGMAIVVTLLVGGGLLHGIQTTPVRPPVVRPPQNAPAAPGCPAWSNPRVPEQWLWPVELAPGGVAWAQGGLRSTDDGAHWREVSPAALHAGNAGLYPPGYAEFFLDGSHAWQAGVYGTATACFDHISVFATGNGGKTWQESRVVVDVPSGEHVGKLQVGFLNAESGWLWVLMEASSFEPGFGPYTDSYLLSTSDGGATWRMVAKITSAIFHAHTNSYCGVSLYNMTFSSTEIGWIAPGTVQQGTPPTPCDNPSTVTTVDGGLTWKVQRELVSCNCWAGVPTFVDQLHGVWQVTSLGPDSSMSLMSTSDGGLTWRALPAPPTGDFLLGLTPHDADDLWILAPPPGWSKGSPSTASWPVYHSADGGETWALTGGAGPIARGWMILFSDARHGMVVQVGGGIGNPLPLLALTSDGGRTWKIVRPVLEQ